MTLQTHRIRLRYNEKIVFDGLIRNRQDLESARVTVTDYFLERAGDGDEIDIDEIGCFLDTIDEVERQMRNPL